MKDMQQKNNKNMCMNLVTMWHKNDVPKSNIQTQKQTQTVGVTQSS